MTEGAFFKKIKEHSLSGTYLLYGEEAYSRNMAVRQTKLLTQDAARELNVQVLREADFIAVKSACESLPFFDDIRVVVVEDSAADTDNSIAAHYTEFPPSTVLLILKSGGSFKKGTLYRELEKADRTVEFKIYEEADAVQFIGNRAQKFKIRIDRPVAVYLVRVIGTDLATLENSLLKLDAYVGHGNEVTREAVDTCVTPNPEYNIFKIIDCFIAGNLKQGLSQMQTELREGRLNPVGAISLIESRVRLMLSAKQMLHLKNTQAEILSALGGSSYGNKMVLQSAQKCSLEMLENTIHAFACADRTFKQGVTNDTDALLLAVYQSFSKENKNI